MITSRPQRHHRSIGFTLIEMLLVITIISILIALLLPAIQQAREAARRTQCKNNLVQLGIALHNYHGSFSVFPPGCVNDRGPIVNAPMGYHMSWLVQLLPMMDGVPLFQQLDFNFGAYDTANGAVAAKMPPGFRCPSDRAGIPSSTAIPPSSYAGCSGGKNEPIDTTNTGLLYLNSSIDFRQIKDGTSHTIAAGERVLDDFEMFDLGWMSGTGATLRHTDLLINDRRSSRVNGIITSGPLMSPMTNQTAPPADQAIGGFSSQHPGGAQFLIADGSVRFISESIDPILFRHLGDREDRSMTGEY